MPYKSIQGPLVLGLALIALVTGASGAPQVDQSQSDSDSSNAAQSLRPQTAEVDRQHGHESRHRSAQEIQREIARLRRYEPLAATDVVTNSVDGAASTIALRGSIGNGAALSYSLAVAPRHGRVTIENGRATYRPNPDFAGVDTYTYRVQSGEHSAEAVVAVTSIREGNLPATAAAAL